MMPDNVLSTTAVVANFTGARSLGVTKTLDFHDGGVAIQDASRGLQYQRWRARLIDAGKASSHVLLDSPNTLAYTLYAVANITEISIAFDQNMRPALAYVADGESKLWWYDSVESDMVVTDIDGTSPRIGLDDPRLIGSNGYSTNDILLMYVRDNVLYYQQQRDRFTIERSLASDIDTPLIKIGLNRQLRLQIMREVKS
jgi:hypothetical protein